MCGFQFAVMSSEDTFKEVYIQATIFGQEVIVCETSIKIVLGTIEFFQ